jgi:hypothetical protein
MKQDTVTASFDAAKLKAIKLYMSRKGVALEPELTEQLNKLYEKYVPVNVRDYIGEAESVDAGNAQPRQVK